MEKSVQITSIIVAGIIIVAIIGYIAISSLNPMQTNIVSANGEAVVKAIPDLVTVYFNIETTGATSKEANDKNSEISDNLITALVKQGFERKDIVTENFNIYPEYNWNSGAQTLKDYKATNSIKVQMPTTDTSKIGDAIDAGANAGASVSYINFELSQEKQNEYKAEALKLASEDAKIKATAIAEGLGKKLGKLVSVSNNNFYYQPWNLYTASTDASGGVANAEDAKRATTSIQPGQQEISASVQATFKI
jgi:hypothetical protein